jgi:uncharacterized protein YciU (UPF0263 family)
MGESSEAADDKSTEIKFSVNKQAYAYLLVLSEKTTLGRTRNEVARQVLIQRLSEMKQENYKLD